MSHAINEFKEKKHTAQLFIGAGKIDLKQLKKDSSKDDETFFRLFIDRSYDKGNSVDFLEDCYAEWLSGNEMQQYDRTLFYNDDLFKFMDSFKFKFDYIEAFRIFEHMEYCSGEIGRLLEACNMLSTSNAKLNIIVPNAIKLSNMLLDYENSRIKIPIDSLNQKLIINTEFCNIKCDPHGSVWSPRLAYEYIESEGTWFIETLEPQINYASRDIYMKIVCTKNKLVKEGM